MSNKYKILTRDLGEVEITDESIITFEKGLFAFEDYKKFVLIDIKNEDGCPLWLQSVDTPSLCFIVFEIKSLINGYDPLPEKEDLDIIKLDNLNDAKVLAIAVIPDDIKKTTINLKSPIIINSNNNKAVQAILTQDYDIKFSLYQNA